MSATSPALNCFTLVRKRGVWLLRDHGTVIAVCASLGIALERAAEAHLTLA